MRKSIEKALKLSKAHSPAATVSGVVDSEVCELVMLVSNSGKPRTFVYAESDAHGEWYEISRAVFEFKATQILWVSSDEGRKQFEV